MNKVLIAVVVVLLAACSREPAQPGIASDGPEAEQPRSEPRIARDTPVNPMPLGFELDYANIEGVKSKLSGVAELEDRGTLELTNGPLLATTGTDLGVEGLKCATLAFNGSGTLEGVVLTFPRGPQHPGATRKLAEQLGKKYQLVSKDFESFMDFGSFRFEQGDSWIVVESPHMSFEMTATYGTKELFAAIDAANAASQKASREKKEAIL